MDWIYSILLTFGCIVVIGLFLEYPFVMIPILLLIILGFVLLSNVEENRINVKKDYYANIYLGFLRDKDHKGARELFVRFMEEFNKKHGRYPIKSIDSDTMEHFIEDVPYEISFREYGPVLVLANSRTDGVRDPEILGREFIRAYLDLYDQPGHNYKRWPEIAPYHEETVREMSKYVSSEFPLEDPYWIFGILLRKNGVDIAIEKKMEILYKQKTALLQEKQMREKEAKHREFFGE